MHTVLSMYLLSMGRSGPIPPPHPVHKTVGLFMAYGLKAHIQCSIKTDPKKKTINKKNVKEHTCAIHSEDLPQYLFY